MVSRSLQGDVGACEGDQGHVWTALGHRCAHAMGVGTHRALVEVVVENVDAIMASSSSSAAATAAPLDLEVPPLPDKVYLPQRKGNIGVGKQYADEGRGGIPSRRRRCEDGKAKKERVVLVKERERIQERIPVRRGPSVWTDRPIRHPAATLKPNSS